MKRVRLPCGARLFVYANSTTTLQAIMNVRLPDGDVSQGNEVLFLGLFVLVATFERICLKRCQPR